MDQKQDRRRGPQRGRRGPDHRGFDRRPLPAPGQPGRDRVDVEQIMQEIRARIAQRRGVDLSSQRIQELAARRLDSVLDPRTIKPGMLDELRRGAGAKGDRLADAGSSSPPDSFDESAIYSSAGAVLRFIRRLLNPLLRLFVDPDPVVRALTIQSQLNVAAAEREADRERQQSEWNALHYEIVKRLVSEVSRVTIELETQSGRLESMSAKVDFNDGRVRGIEGVVHQSRPASRPAEVPVAASSPSDIEPAEGVADGSQSSEGAKRRRRRRRGRRGSGGGPGDAAPSAPSAESWPVLPAPSLETDASGGQDPVDTLVPPPAPIEGEVLLQPEWRDATPEALPAPVASALEATVPPREPADATYPASTDRPYPESAGRTDPDSTER